MATPSFIPSGPHDSALVFDENGISHRHAIIAWQIHPGYKTHAYAQPILAVDVGIERVVVESGGGYIYQGIYYSDQASLKQALK